MNAAGSRGARRRVGSGLVVACLLASPVAFAGERPPFDPGVVDFTVRVDDERTNLRIFSRFVMPGADVTIRVEPGPAGRDGAGRTFGVHTPEGVETVRAGSHVRWRAPKTPGLTVIDVRESGVSAGAPFLRLNVFVMRPASEVRDGVLRGYRIGAYPKRALRGLAMYTPPKGFVEVTDALRDVPVTPHFTLGQFLCKQEGDFPKYLVLRERLLLKLEVLLQQVNAAGHRCDGFVVMSGYRTPAYNAAIGNVDYSRHLWGGAADIYIDENPADGMMDDLDGNGRCDVGDADVLKNLVESMSDRPWFAPFVGGLARYRANEVHGPFVHVDVRGTRARWGS